MADRLPRLGPRRTGQSMPKAALTPERRKPPVSGRCTSDMIDKLALRLRDLNSAYKAAHKYAGLQRPHFGMTVRQMRLDVLPSTLCLESGSDQLAEDLVHDLGTACQGRNDLVPVDQFRRGCLVVAGQQRDRLHWNTASGKLVESIVPT